MLMSHPVGAGNQGTMVLTWEFPAPRGLRHASGDLETPAHSLACFRVPLLSGQIEPYR